MRTRKEIYKQMSENKIPSYYQTLMEVILDVRDLLKEINEKDFIKNFGQINLKKSDSEKVENGK